MSAQGERVTEAVDRLVAEVSAWPHVTTGEHRFGGTEFRVGAREIGHVHAWGMLDVAYLRGLRDRLVDVEGELATLGLSDEQQAAFEPRATT